MPVLQREIGKKSIDALGNTRVRRWWPVTEPFFFAELRRLRLRWMKFVREQFFLAAAVHNLKRLIRFLSPTDPTVKATT